ncbi:restriction endonuclease subunit S [Streptococcus rifensis]
MADGTIQEIDVPYEIPDSWEWVRLENITKLIIDGTHSTPNYASTGIPFLSVKDMSSGFLDFSSTKFITSEEHAILSMRTKPERNDILLSKVGTTGIPVKVDTDTEFSIFVSLALLKFILPFNPDFIVHLIKSPLVFEQSKKGTRGVGNKNLVLQTIKKFLIPIPPLAEQKRIVEQIELALAKVDEYAESYNRLQKLDKEFPDKLKKSILQYAMQGKLVEQDPNDEPVEVLLEKIRVEKQRLFAEGKLKKKDLEETIITQGGDNSYYGKLPKNWLQTTINNVGIITTGNTPPKNELSNYGGSIPFYKPADLSQGFMMSAKENLTSKGLLKARAITKNSILVNGIGNIGVSGIVGVDGAFNQQMHGITPFNFINIYFLFFAIQSDMIQNQFRKNSSSTTIPILNKSRFSQTIIRIPSLSTQKAIVAKIDLLFQKVAPLYLQS